MITSINLRPILAGCLAILMALALVSAAYAFPQLPFNPHGTVVVNGVPASGGLLIGARCGGAQVATTNTVIYNGQALYSLDVPGDDPATPAVEGCVPQALVTFTVGGIPADQSAAWVSGGSPILNLTVNGLRRLFLPYIRR